MVGRDEGNSPFLAIPRDRWLASNDLAFAVLDRFPVSPGHTLVVPRRVVANWWEAPEVPLIAVPGFMCGPG